MCGLLLWVTKSPSGSHAGIVGESFPEDRNAAPTPYVPQCPSGLRKRRSGLRISSRRMHLAAAIPAGIPRNRPCSLTNGARRACSPNKRPSGRLACVDMAVNRAPNQPIINDFPRGWTFCYPHQLKLPSAADCEERSEFQPSVRALRQSD